MTKMYYMLMSCLMLVSLPLLAQEPAQTARLELDIDSDYTTFEVMALPDSSLLLYTKVSKGWNDGKFEFVKYNHSLEKVWHTQQELDTESEYIYHYVEQPYLYIAFEQADRQEFLFLKLSLTDGKATPLKFKIPDIDSVEEFVVLNEHFFVIGNDRKTYRPAFFHLNPESNLVSPLPSVYGKESFFSDLLADSKQVRTDAVLLESNGRVSHLQTKSFDPNGKLIGTYFTPPQRNRLLQKAQISAGDTASKLLIGTYGQNSVEYATGFFTMPLLHNYDSGQFYSFTDLKNTLSHLKPGQEKRIRNREQRRAKKRKQPYVKHQTLLHNLIPTPEGFILAAEAYTTQYQSRQNVAITFPGVPSLSREETYKHTQVFVVAFNKDGELLWDNSFKLDNIVTDNLEPTVEVAAAPDGRVIIALPDKEEVIYRVMDKGNYTDEKTTFQLMGSSKEDKILNTFAHGVIKWYGANFAAFGFHRVRAANNEARNVFYINKISF